MKQGVRQDSQSFNLIIEFHPCPLSQIQEYLLDNFKIDLQDDSLVPISFSDVKNGSICLFLAKNFTTLDSQLPKLISQPSSKMTLSLSKRILDILQTAHESEEDQIFGFNLYPGSLLFSIEGDNFSFAILDFVSTENIPQLPQGTQTKWVTDFAPRELFPRTNKGPLKKPTIGSSCFGGTKKSDIYMLGQLFQKLLKDSPAKNKLLSKTLENNPKDRPDISEFKKEFGEYEQYILGQEVLEGEQDDMSFFEPNESLIEEQMKKFGGYLPFGWTSEIENQNFKEIRVEIVVFLYK